MKSAPRTPEEAVASARRQSENGPQFGRGLCKMQARLRYLVPSNGSPDATASWKQAQFKFPTNDPSTAPYGAFHWWTGGSDGHGHVAVEGGPTWSTDIRRSGFYDATTVSAINAKWGGGTNGLEYKGWSLDIDGVLCVPGKVDYLQRLLHPNKPVPPKPRLKPLPLTRRARILTRLSRQARQQGRVQFADRLLMWAERVSAAAKRQANEKN